MLWSSFAFEYCVTPMSDPLQPDELPYPRKVDRIAKKAHGTFLFASGIGLAAFLTWMGLTELDQVTRGTGRVVPQIENHVVEHFDGGIVSDILVREGQPVARGDVLMRVENSFSAAELSQAHLELKAQRVRRARLSAETEGRDRLEIPTGLTVDIPAIIERELTLFQRRRVALAEQVAILNDQMRQKELELSESQSRWENTKRERELVLQHVESLRGLVDKGAISRNDLLENERQLAQIETRLSDLVHVIPRIEASLSESRRRSNEIVLKFQSDAERELSDTQIAIAKLEEQIVAMADRSQRSDVTAPISGTVNAMFVNTVDSVVKSGEPLLEIVPSDAPIAVEVRISPSDRGDVWPGLPAVVKISAYEYSVYGGLEGRVVEVSPDALSDEQGVPYFRVRLEADGDAFGPANPIIPGMLADVDIMTGRKTIMSNLIRPVRQITDNALRQ